MSTDVTVEDLSRNNSIEKIIKKLNQSTSCREAIEGLESLSIDPPSCWEAIEIAIRRSWKAR